MIRKELCVEAIRLALLVAEHPVGRIPKTYALLALMCLHAARFESRINSHGDLVLLSEQERKLWDQELIGQGIYFLNLAAEGREVSHFHLEAGIAALHCQARSFEETDWEQILNLYDWLLAIKTSPVSLLKRAIVVAQTQGPLVAIEEIHRIEGLEEYYLFHATLGELYLRVQNHDAARCHLERALALTSSAAERRLLASKLQKCSSANDDSCVATVDSAAGMATTSSR